MKLFSVKFKSLKKYSNDKKKPWRTAIERIKLSVLKFLFLAHKYNIKYDIQYRFDDCKNILTLPFDFKLKKNGRPICIEFDGDMHFKPRGTDTIEYFIQRKINDGLKNEYCLNNGIKLIRIPYWETQNIEKILIKELNLYN